MLQSIHKVARCPCLNNESDINRINLTSRVLWMAQLFVAVEIIRADKRKFVCILTVAC